MTISECANTIQGFGYTLREASFLATVALHSGYFVMRQFAPQGGKSAIQFARKIMALEHVTVRKFVSNTSLYHLKSKSLYRAIQQENNRHRRLHDIGHVRLKVMGLDYVIAHPDSCFLPTEEEKLAYFCGERSIAKSVFPAKTYLGKGCSTERFFVDKNPVRIDRTTGKVTFCFVDDSPVSLLNFDTWLTQYDALIRELHHVEVVFISANPIHFEAAQRRFSQQFFATEQTHSSALLTYFELRKKLESNQLRNSPVAVLDRYKNLRKLFSDAKTEERYRSWLSGDIDPETEAFLTFSAYRLEHSCRFFGVKTKTGS